MTGKKSVFSRQRLGPHAPLDNVRIEIDAAVFEEARQAFPVLERIADGIGDGRFGRDAAELLFEERFEGVHVMSRFLLANRSSFFGAFPPDLLFDAIKLCDAQKRLRGDGRIALARDVEEGPPAMRPAKCGGNAIFG